MRKIKNFYKISILGGTRSGKRRIFDDFDTPTRVRISDVSLDLRGNIGYNSDVFLSQTAIFGIFGGIGVSYEKNQEFLKKIDFGGYWMEKIVIFDEFGGGP